MYAFNRTNRIGMQFYIMELPDARTEIRSQTNKITVNHDVHKIETAWFRWIGHNQYIQDAFKFLTDDEREFLLTGITPEQWENYFAEKEPK